MSCANTASVVIFHNCIPPFSISSSPDGRKFRTRNELKTYIDKNGLDMNPDDVDFTIWGRNANVPPGGPPGPQPPHPSTSGAAPTGPAGQRPPGPHQGPHGPMGHPPHGHGPPGPPGPPGEPRARARQGSVVDDPCIVTPSLSHSLTDSFRSCSSSSSSSFLSSCVASVRLWSSPSSSDGRGLYRWPHPHSFHHHLLLLLFLLAADRVCSGRPVPPAPRLPDPCGRRRRPPPHQPIPSSALLFLLRCGGPGTAAATAAGNLGAARSGLLRVTNKHHHPSFCCCLRDDRGEACLTTPVQTALVPGYYNLPTLLRDPDSYQMHQDSSLDPHNN